jgi:hypothetical protein
MNKRMRNKFRWDITVHYDRRPWLTYAARQSTARLDKLIHQATLDSTIELVYATQFSYRKIRVSGGMFLIEKQKFRGYTQPSRKPHLRGIVHTRTFTSSKQLKHDAEAYERYCTPDEEEEMNNPS